MLKFIKFQERTLIASYDSLMQLMDTALQKVTDWRDTSGAEIVSMQWSIIRGAGQMDPGAAIIEVVYDDGKSPTNPDLHAQGSAVPPTPDGGNSKPHEA